MGGSGPRNTHRIYAPAGVQDAEEENPGDDVIADGFSALCRYAAECRETARAAIAAKRRKLDRRARDHVRDVAGATERLQRVQLLHLQVNAQRSAARFTKYLTTVLRLSYDNAKVTIDLRRTSNLQNVLRRTQGTIRLQSCKIV